MAENELLEFCSKQWVDFAREYLLEVSKDSNLTGIDVSFNEVVTDAPASLDPDADGRAGWYLRVRNGAIEVECGLLEEADYRVEMDYETVLPIARLVYKGHPENVEAAAKIGEAAAAAGKLKTEGDQAALAKLDWLAGLHDVMAVRTA